MHRSGYATVPSFYGRFFDAFYFSLTFLFFLRTRALARALRAILSVLFLVIRAWRRLKAAVGTAAWALFFPAGQVLCAAERPAPRRRLFFLLYGQRVVGCALMNFTHTRTARLEWMVNREHVQARGYCRKEDKGFCNWTYLGTEKGWGEWGIV